ncbi:MAG: SpoIID/LytB domain-containing protein [Spirochaetia bacterium]|nr:SpoIID/LytB domain-containing protein [Spirochaetia bacterium]
MTKKAAMLLLWLPLLFVVPRIAFPSARDDYYSGNIEKAITSYAFMAENDPRNLVSLYDLASIYKEFGRNREAFDAYRAIVTANPSENRARFELAKVYYFLGAYNYAADMFESLEQNGIVNWELYYWRGCAALEQGQFDTALTLFNKSAELDPRKAVIYMKLAELCIKKNDTDCAIDNYKTAMKKDKTFTELNRRLAELYEKKGDRINSFIYWKKVGEIDTTDKTAAKKVEEGIAKVPELKEKAVNYIAARQKIRDEFIPRDMAPVADAEKIIVLKVGIMENVSAISFKCGSDFDFENDRAEAISRGEKLKEYFFQYDREKKQAFFSDGGRRIYFKDEIRIKKDNREATTTFYSVQYGEGFFWSEKKDTTYRGDFLIKSREKTLTLINVVNMEEYLYGVVASEIPPDWPGEALKSQAVAARTYTFKHMDRHRKQGFDVCAQQHCAVYTGVNGEDRRTNRAVDDTRGQALYGSNYKMLDTFFSHCCGGHTNDANEVWGLKKVASLGGVYDGKKQDRDFPLAPFSLEEYVRTKPDVYCRADGNIETSFRWIRYLDADSVNQYMDKKGELGRIKDIRPVSRSNGGALLKVRIEGEKGTKTYGFDSMRNVLGKIRSNVIKWEYSKDEKGFIKELYIYGAGWGHGVGMCQRGLKGMAEDGERYESILYHYFPGSYIKPQY